MAIKQIDESEMFMKVGEFGEFLDKYDNLELFKTNNQQTKEFVEKNKEKYMAQYVFDMYDEQKPNYNKDKSHDYYIMETETLDENGKTISTEKKLMIKIKDI